jgi:hypothetical protein
MPLYPNFYYPQCLYIPTSITLNASISPLLLPSMPLYPHLYYPQCLYIPTSITLNVSISQPTLPQLPLYPPLENLLTSLI